MAFMEGAEGSRYSLGYVPPTVDMSYTQGMDITHGGVTTNQPQ